MRSAMQALSIENDDLKEHSYVFFANTSKVMGHGFDPYLATLLPHLLAVITENELIAGADSDDEDVDDDQNGDDDDGSDRGKDMRLNVHEGFINNKKAALTAVGAMAEYTKESFAPYLESTLDTLIVDQMGALYSFHDIIRAEALECLPQLVCVACHATGVTALPNKLQVIVLPDLTAEIVRTAMKYLLLAMAEDEAKGPVSTALESVRSIIARVGVACLTLQVTPSTGPRIIDDLMQRILIIMNEKAPCQRVSSGDGHGDDEENDHDNIVMDSASDLIGTLAKTIGDQMIPFFDQLQKPLMRFLKPARPFSDRAMAMGCYAEVLLEFGPAALKYVENLMPLIKAGLADQMESVRRNSAYCVGVLVQATGLALAPHFMSILQALYPLCTRSADKMASDTGGADVDNALSSVARIINTGGASLIPLAQVLPVMLAALPLRSDTSEGPNIYGCLIDLVIAGDASSISLLPQILNAFGEALLPDSNAVQEVKEKVTCCLKELATGSPAHQQSFHAAIEHVEQAYRTSIQVVLST
jgi:importin-4